MTQAPERRAARLAAAGLAASLAMAVLAAPAAAEDVAIVLDASNSMWGQIDGVSKIEIAREVMADIVDDFGPDARLGLVAYGHRRQGDCGDIETVIPVGGADRATFLETFDSLTPRGKTPLTDAVRHAAEMLSWQDTPATVVLLSDGIETCNADPCAVAAELERAGVAFTAHVIGFDLAGEEERAQLSCIAENTGGQFFAAANAEELAAALGQTARAVAEPSPPPKPEAPPKPEPEPEPEPAVAIDAPAQAIAGATLTVSWDPTLNPRDLVTIVPADADEDEVGVHVRTDRGSPAELTAPGMPGPHEVRYVLDDGRTVQGRAAILLVDGEVTLEVPETVPAGARFEAAWEGTVNDRDFITIVPAEAPDDEIGNHQRAGRGSPAELTAPGTPGLYELRYVLDQGRRPLARALVEVTGSEVTLEVPETVPAGARFEAAWEGTVNDRDFITIVPAEAPDDEIGNHQRAGRGSPAELTAPGTPGLYELRYVLDQGRRPLARALVEVTEPSPTLGIEGQAQAGGTVVVQVGGVVNPRDFVTLVEPDQPEDEIGGHVRAREGGRIELAAPDVPGLYEVRYVLDQGRRMLASAPVEVVAVSAALEGPGQVVAGSRFPVAWEGPNRRNDRIVLVPADAPDGAEPLAEADPEAPVDPVRLDAPAEPGTYELRYVLGTTGEVIARDELEVVRLEASLKSVERAPAGGTIQVAWTGPGNERDRVTLAEVGASDTTWASAARVSDGNPVTLEVPDRPGTYELRYLDFANRTILVRQSLVVE